MRKNSIFKRWAALFLATVVGITVSGCGTKEPSGSETGTQASITEENPSDTGQENTDDNNGMGRYVESTVLECEYWDRVDTQTLDDGQIVFVNSMTGRKMVSGDKGNTWEVEESEAFTVFTQEHYPVSTAIAKDGTLALVCMEKPEGSEDYVYNLYIYNTDDTTRQIPFEQPDADSYLHDVAFDDQGNLYAYVSGCRYIYKVDVNEGTAEKLTELQANCQRMQCEKNILMLVCSEEIFLYDLKKKSFIEDETLDNFIAETYNDLSWTGAGYVNYPFLGADNIVYIAGEKGLYRHVIGGSAVEQVIDGGLSSLGAPSHGVMAMTVNDQNEFLTAYSDNKIVKFTYDATVSTIPNDKITVYSLTDDEMVRQTIAAYQTQYPDFYIEYQIGMDEGGITREDALKKLNTQLLGGSGPDVIMLDGMDIATYAEKGVLMDLSDIVREIDQIDGLYTNLIENIQTDDKMYAVPAKFFIPVLFGDKTYVGSADDYQSIADMAEQAREAYPDTNILGVCSSTGVMRRFMPVCAPTWKDADGQLNQGSVRAFLEQSKRLYDVEMNGTPEEYIQQYQQNMIDEDGRNFEEEPYFMMTQDTLYLMQETPFAYGEVMSASIYRDILSVPRIDGLEDTLIKLMSGQCGNVYHPASIAGINSATQNADAAKQFVGMMLGATVQEAMQFGLPINKKALPAQFAYDESELGDDGGQYYMGFSTKDGKSFDYTIYPVQQDGIDKLEAWIAQLDTPYLSDTVLEAAVYAEGAKYLEGTQDIDAAVKAIADSVEIYLYE